MSMRMIGVDSNNDIYVGPDGNLAIVFDLTACEQMCEQVMKTMLAEMVLAYNQGLPNFQTIWVGSPNVMQFEAASRVALQSVPNVVDVLQFDTVVSSNSLQYTAVIQTAFGETSINGRI